MATARIGRTAIRAVGITVAASVLTVAGIGFAGANEVYNSMHHIDVFGPLANRPADDGGTNILLVGSDDRTGLNRKQRKELHVGQGDYGRHTDSIMIVHIASNGAVDLVSIPRDSDVMLPAHRGENGSWVPERRDKINAAYTYGGPTLTVETIEANTGVHIDHYAEVNFAGFVTMVDGLGGVPVCSAKPMTDPKSGLQLKAGTTVLDGPQALAYVRSRYVDASSDYGRMKRQQAFMFAMFNRATSLDTLLNPARLMSFMDAAANSVTVDIELDRAELFSLLGQLRGISRDAIGFHTVPTTGNPNAAGNEVWDTDKSEALFAKLRSGSPIKTPDPAKSSGKTDGASSGAAGSGIASMTGGENDVRQDVCG